VEDIYDSGLGSYSNKNLRLGKGELSKKFSKQGRLTERESTVELLLKVACSVTKVNNIFKYVELLV
jgi:hypothetical protein